MEADLISRAITPKSIAPGGPVAEDTRDAATYAMDLLDSFQRDEERDARLRYWSAKLLLERILGKPRQSVELTGAEGKPLFPPDQQQRLLQDPEALEMACTLDAKLARNPSDHPGGVREERQPGEVDLPSPPGPPEPEAG